MPRSRGGDAEPKAVQGRRPGVGGRWRRSPPATSPATMRWRRRRAPSCGSPLCASRRRRASASRWCRSRRSIALAHVEHGLRDRPAFDLDRWPTGDLGLAARPLDHAALHEAAQAVVLRIGSLDDRDVLAAVRDDDLLALAGQVDVLAEVRLELSDADRGHCDLIWRRVADYMSMRRSEWSCKMTTAVRRRGGAAGGRDRVELARCLPVSPAPCRRCCLSP